MPDALPQAASGTATARRTLRVKRMTWEAPGVISLDLVAPDGGAQPAFEPGAHLDLHLPGAPVRQYSLCGDPRTARAGASPCARSRAAASPP